MPQHEVEELKFARWGFRVAVIDDQGNLELDSDFDAEQYGGLIPEVGDMICAIGPGNYDGEPLEVVKRCYVSEFHGETCWWIVARTMPVDDLAKAVFRLARKTAKANLSTAKRIKEAQKSGYESLLEIRERMKAQAKERGQQPRLAPLRDRPWTPKTLAAEWSVTAQHIRDLIRTGELKHFRVGRLIRISKAAAEDYRRRADAE